MAHASGPSPAQGADYSAGLLIAAQRTQNTVIYADASKQDPNSPDYQCASYRDQIGDVHIVRAVHGGTKAMRAEGKKFLPQHPMEEELKWRTRLSIAIAFNALKKTVEGLSGMIFRRDPTLSDDTPAVLVEQLANIDQRGSSLAVFLRKIADQALLDGHTWVHVEAPEEQVGVRTAADAESAGIQTYWINIKKDAAINWRYDVRAGRPILTLFVYCEAARKNVGSFGESEVQRIRVLREGSLDATGVRGNVIGELWELVDAKDDKGNDVKKWARVDTYEVAITELPVFIVYAEEEGDFASVPPLMDLAYEQIEHYRVRSERQKSMTFSSIGVPYVFGEGVTDEEGVPKIKWGSDGMLLLNVANATAGILESSGNGLASQLEELNAIKANMAALGLRMLVSRQSGTQPTTATADILEKSEGNAALATFATELENAANKGLEIQARYRSDLQGAPGTITINRDFHEQLLDPQWVTVLGDQVAAGRMSLDTMWDILVKGELLPEEFDAAEERVRIEEDAAAGLGAAAAVAALQAAQNPQPAPMGAQA